jgi:hypothetical protein
METMNVNDEGEKGGRRRRKEEGERMWWCWWIKLGWRRRKATAGKRRGF